MHSIRMDGSYDRRIGRQVFYPLSSLSIPVHTDLEIKFSFLLDKGGFLCYNTRTIFQRDFSKSEEYQWLFRREETQRQGDARGEHTGNRA